MHRLSAGVVAVLVASALAPTSVVGQGTAPAAGTEKPGGVLGVIDALGQ